MRRSQNEIKDINKICEIMDQCSVCRIAINNGIYPYIVPMNFGYVRKAEKIFLYFHGANAGTKKELIAKDGHIAFEMDIHGEAEIREIACNSYMDYESVCGVGNASLVEGTEKETYLRAIMEHYTNIPYQMLEKAVAATMVIQVEVTEITGKFHKTK